MSHLDRRLDEVPIAILDFETTGLSPRSGCRVVEVALVRCEPGQTPVVVLDTLVDPQGPVLATRIHGISDEDVEGAPLFSDIADDLVAGMQGALVGSFNASFDMAFYRAEMKAFRRGQSLREPPHVCMMWLRPLLGVGSRCSLANACEELSISSGSHRAAEDALATAFLWQHYLAAASRNGLRTLRDLRMSGTHAYLASLDWEPYSTSDLSSIGRESGSFALKPRLGGIRVPCIGAEGASVIDQEAAIRMYWQALCAAFRDEEITPDEVEYLHAEQRRTGLSEEARRTVHARFFADRLIHATEDDVVTSEEARVISQLHAALATLGWAPGASGTH